MEMTGVYVAWLLSLENRMASDFLGAMAMSLSSTHCLMAAAAVVRAASLASA